MKLKKVTICNFRSIKGTNSIELGDYTVLIGKNNEGKTNVLLGIRIALNEIYFNTRRFIGNTYQNSGLHRNRFNTSLDYPISIDPDKRYRFPTKIILFFTLNKTEINSFKKETSLDTNGHINIEIKYSFSKENNNFPKMDINFYRLKKPLLINYEKYNTSIFLFIRKNFKFTYIPATRTTEQANEIVGELIYDQLDVLESDDEYNKAKSIIQSKENKVLKETGHSLLPTLKEFLPDIKKVNIKMVDDSFDTYKIFNNLSWEMNIDDGIESNITSKGDGVKNLVAISLLKNHSNNDSGFVAIEEPESHLHSGAIHIVSKVLNDISNNRQVIITSHNPCFICHKNIENNILVSNGKCHPAKNIFEIRKELGISVSEAMVTSEYVVLVEGKSDLIIYKHLFSILNKKMNEMISQNLITFYACGGASKIPDFYHLFDAWLLQCYIIVDNDDEGITSYNKINDEGFNGIVTLCGLGKKKSEIEDLLPASLIDNILKNYINTKDKNYLKDRKTENFSCYLRKSFSKQGKRINDNQESQIKTLIAKKVCSNVNQNSLNNYAKEFLNNIIQDILKKWKL